MSDQQPVDPRAQQGPDVPDPNAAVPPPPEPQAQWSVPIAGPSAQPAGDQPTVQYPAGGPTAQYPAGEPTAQYPAGEPSVQYPAGEPSVQYPAGEPTFRYPDPAGFASSAQANPWAAPHAMPTAPGVVVDPRRGHRRHAVLTGVAASILSLVLIGGGVVIGEHSRATTATTARNSQTGQLPDGFGSRRGGFVDPDGSSDGSGAQQPGFDTGPQTGTSQSSATTATAAQQVGVVTIDSVLGYQNGESAGTGMILTANGTVLTNNHVIEGATAIKVTVESTGATYTATVVGTDASADVAVLKLEGASKLTPVTLDTKDAVATGDSVTAVGNAEGTGTLVAATGAVTGTDQTMTASENGAASETLSGLIEFAADVVSGDSGGPVLNSAGQVVGITTAASSGSATTVAYAIGIDNAMAVVKKIEAGSTANGIVQGYPAFLGVELSQSDQLATGATIAGVVAGTPAASAGLTAGDTITAVDGTAITAGTDLSAAMAQHSPGDKVTITWTSGSTGASQSATVTLVKGPAA